jgi:hypothetical protein
MNGTPVLPCFKPSSRPTNTCIERPWRAE